ncbi:MAG: diacylglycerol kinase family protein [Pedobacter sp.]|nr:MAG: diacylglycerol kinase family protein [Pedobacter sp.]
MNKLIKSFGYSFQGIAAAFRTEWNFRFHLVATLIVVLLSWFFELNANEWMWVILAAGMVISAELFNTAIEVLVDLVSPNIHPKAKIIKDVASAAVLVTAIAALIIGLIIFIPKVWLYAA